LNGRGSAIGAEAETIVKRLSWRNADTHESLVVSEMVTQLYDQYWACSAINAEINS